METIENQQKVWNNIASEWHKFKIDKPSEHVKEFLKGKSGNILDVGSGSGRHLLKLKKSTLYLVDFSEKMIKLAKNKAKKENIKAEFNVSNLTSLPYQDNFFDYAISIASLHCLKPENHSLAVKELYRVLKPKAEVLVEVWNKNSIRFKNSGKEKFISWRDKGKRYYYLFEEKEIFNLFKKNKFKIKNKLEHRVNISFIAQK